MLVPSIFGETLLDDLFGYTQPQEAAGNRRFLVETGSMKTDIKETEDAFQLDVELPGYKKEDVSAELKDGYLTIRANTERKSEEKDAKGNYIRRERYTGSCSRSYYVGEDVTEEDITAKFTDGILSLVVPKIEKKPQVPEKKFIAIQ